MPNNHYILEHVCEIVGQRIKIEGPEYEVGLWMVPVADSTKAMKVTRIVRNEPSLVEFIPVDTGYAENRIEIRTRFTGANAPLLSARNFQSPFSIMRA